MRMTIRSVTLTASETNTGEREVHETVSPRLTLTSERITCVHFKVARDGATGLRPKAGGVINMTKM